jgi:hypothetical protein
MLLVFGLILIDVTILTIYTALESFSAQFSAGREPNKEKPRAVVGVSRLLIKAEHACIRSNTQGNRY